MIRKLRLKFVLICMSLVTAILAVVFSSVFFAIRQNVRDLSRQLLYQVAQNESSLGTGGLPSAQITIGDHHVVLLPYFTVNVYPNTSGYLADVTGGTYANLDDSETLTAILQDCLHQPQNEGVIQDYHLRYLRQDRGFYTRLAFVDMSMEQAILREMMGSYLIIAAGALALLLGVSILLSWWATRPVEKAWRQQRQFLSDASHELKTPLTVILSNAELLEGTALEPRPARWADNIHSEARQMKALVEEMLTLARADNMGPTAVLTEVSLSDVAADCALAFEPVAFESGKSLDYQLTEDVLVLGDRDKLRQLASILLDNALTYTPAGKQVTLSACRRETRGHKKAGVTFAVSDQGCGVPDADKKHVFDRFYRADGSRTDRQHYGLGLSVAKELVQLHGGTIGLEDAEGGGARFLVYLPSRG